MTKFRLGLWSRGIFLHIRPLEGAHIHIALSSFPFLFILFDTILYAVWLMVAFSHPPVLQVSFHAFDFLRVASFSLSTRFTHHSLSSPSRRNKDQVPRPKSHPAHRFLLCFYNYSRSSRLDGEGSFSEETLKLAYIILAFLFVHASSFFV